ncbi:MAG: hypothetical protein KY459_02815 [Acidobacteria bacterium]|nr:hypothetical protein [Acidobacteriota bacterium]
MGEFGKVLLLALIPAAGVIGGGLVGELMAISRKARSMALHAAAGIVLSVVAVELLPEAITVDPPWAAIVAFACGGLFFVGIDRAVDLIASRDGESWGQSQKRNLTRWRVKSPPR